MLCHNGSLETTTRGPGHREPASVWCRRHADVHDVPRRRSGGRRRSRARARAAAAGDRRRPEVAHRPPRVLQSAHARGHRQVPRLLGQRAHLHGARVPAVHQPRRPACRHAGQSCGQCHAAHSEEVAASLLATEAGILSGAPTRSARRAACRRARACTRTRPRTSSFRAVANVDFNVLSNGRRSAKWAPDRVPGVQRVRCDRRDAILQQPPVPRERARSTINPDGTVITGSPLAKLFHEQVAFTCGDCHLGSAAPTTATATSVRRAAAACHMPYSLGGRSGSRDPNVNKLEPLDPDDIDEPERRTCVRTASRASRRRCQRRAVRASTTTRAPAATRAATAR
jgi:hypothetical protein